MLVLENKLKGFFFCLFFLFCFVFYQQLMYAHTLKRVSKTAQLGKRVCPYFYGFLPYFHVKLRSTVKMTLKYM